MLIRKPDDGPSSEITPERVYFSRREFLGHATAAADVPGRTVTSATGAVSVTLEEVSRRRADGRLGTANLVIGQITPHVARQ